MDKIELPSPEEMKQKIPASEESLQYIQKSRSELSAILKGEDPRLILIAGPCSIHEIDSAKEYALKLKELSETISDRFFLLMRVYFAKPRTRTGWKGILYDPYIDGSHNIQTGIEWTRQLLVDLAEMKLPIATEILDPLTTSYFSDLITWGCIGARTSESQIHREAASGLPMPVGFKNNTAGNIQIAVDGAFCASIPHTYIGLNENGKLSSMRTKGNDCCHIVLRGGAENTNYDPLSIEDTIKRLAKSGLHTKIIIDCSHDNSKQGEEEQIIAFKSIINQVLEGNKQIAGLILESHLQAGRQEISINRSCSFEYGKSITDPCLDWATTKNLIMWGYNHFKIEETIQQRRTYRDESCLILSTTP